eukprot:343433_1
MASKLLLVACALFNNIITTVICQEFIEYDGILPITVRGHCVGRFNNTLSIVGGESKNFDTNVHALYLNMDNITWYMEYSKWAINGPYTYYSLFEGQTCIQHHNLLYGVPGTAHQLGKTLFIFNLLTHKYFDLTSYNFSIPVSAYDSCVQVANNELYVIGGLNCPKSWSCTISDVVQSYHIIEDAWTFKDSINTARHGHGCALNSEYVNSVQSIFIFGGEGSSYFRSIEQYNISANYWSILDAKLMTERTHHQCIFITELTQQIWCIGGYGRLSQYRELSDHEFVNVQRFNPNTLQMVYNRNVSVNTARKNFAMYRNSHGNVVILGGYHVHSISHDSMTISYLGSIETSRHTSSPTSSPTAAPSMQPTTYTLSPTIAPTMSPSIVTINPTIAPSSSSSPPTIYPSNSPSVPPSTAPTFSPTLTPSTSPIFSPTKSPTFFPTESPTTTPTLQPSLSPSYVPTVSPTTAPSHVTVTPTFQTPSYQTESTTFTSTFKPSVAITTSTSTPQHKFDSQHSTHKLKLYTAIISALVICICIVVIIFYVFKVKRNRRKRYLDVDVEMNSIPIDGKSKPYAYNYLEPIDNDNNVLNVKEIADRLVIQSAKYSHIIIQQDIIDLHSINVAQNVDDYHYLLERYEEDEDQFEFLIQNNSASKCDINKCMAFRRNHRSCVNSDESKLILNIENKQDIVGAEIMDKIHCFCHHLGDIQTYLRVSKHTTVSDVKKNIFQTLEERMNVKYNQLYKNECRLFIFGWEFIYVDSDFAEEKIQSDNAHDIIMIRQKYNSLKKEIIMNNIHRLTIQQYNNEYRKAELHWNTPFRKCYYPVISVPHLLSLMIYCNFDEFQNEFSKTYREENGVNHTYFYHIGKLLKESILGFGTTINDGDISKFYHGVNQQLVPFEIVGDLGKGISIFCPLSTSSSLSIAVNFSDCDNGLIMTFGGKTSKAKYFSVAWLSDFQYEKEYLFLQNKHEIQIINIIDYTNGIEFDSILNALKAMDFIFCDMHFYQDEKAIKPIELILKLILHQLCQNTNDQKGESFKSLNDYGKNLVETYFYEKTKLMIDYLILEQKYSQLFKLICFIDYNWINIQILNAIFPNIQLIEIRNITLSPHVFQNISENRSIFQYTKNKKTSWNLNKMIIKATKDSNYTAVDAVKQYKRQFKENEEVRINIRTIELDNDYDTVLIE